MSQTPLSPPPPISSQGFNDPNFQRWLYLLYQRVSQAGQITTTQITGTVQSTQFPALTGDVITDSGSTVTRLSQVNNNSGTFGDQSNIPSVTVDSKGRVTNVSLVPISASGSGIGIPGQDGEDGDTGYVMLQPTIIAGGSGITIAQARAITTLRI